MNDVKTLRLASTAISQASLQAFLVYQRTLVAGLASPSDDDRGSWAGRFAFAHARALQASGLDGLTQQQLKAVVGEYAGRRSAWLTVRQRVAEAAAAVERARAQGQAAPAKDQALFERAQLELDRLEDLSQFAERYGDETLAVLRANDLEVVTLHRELSRLEGEGTCTAESAKGRSSLTRHSGSVRSRAEMTTKKDLKELKAPDEFQKIGQQAVPFLEQHGRNIALAVTAFVAVGGGVALFGHVQKRGNEAAMYEYGAALAVLEREVNANAPADAPKDEEPPFRTEREKDEALIGKLTAFRNANKGKRPATNAALPLAQALLRQGKAEEALRLVEEYLRDANAEDPLRPVALETRGYALESTGKLDEAAAAFERLAQENKTDFMKGMGLYHHARILERKNDLTGAMKRYAEVTSSAADSSAARLARERMGLLAARGVTLPEAGATNADAGL